MTEDKETMYLISAKERIDLAIADMEYAQHASGTSYLYIRNKLDELKQEIRGRLEEIRRLM